MAPSSPASPNGSPDWAAVAARLSAVSPDELSAEQLDELASAWFWLDDPWRGVEVRRLAHRRWLDDGDTERAARSAWHVFYEHWLVGEEAVAKGWLARARRLVDRPGSATAGWLAVADADVAAAAARFAEADDLARRAGAVGRAVGDPDLVAMALQAEGRARIALGQTEVGLARLDEAMVAVIGNELQPLYTGWIYCTVVSTCHAVADLRRANEWSAAALRWCTTVRDGRLYPGLCRVYSAQLAQLRGEWDEAERAARLACDDLLAFDRRYAGAAHSLVGDLCRLRGRVAEAEWFYGRSHELGHDPQPGLALLHAGRGRLEEALATLRPLVDAPGPPLERMQRLAAVTELAERAGQADVVAAAAARAEVVAADGHGEVVEAFARSIRGRAALVRGEPEAAVELLQGAVARFVDLGLPYEAAGSRMQLARAARAVGDDLTADLESSAAQAVLDELGARAAAGDDRPVLSGREVEVLGLVAEGLTNRDVADRLHLSPHTVARHLGNIFTKLGVGNRTAAVAAASERGLLR